MKLLCAIFGHRWPRWSRINGKYTRICPRCGTVEIDSSRTPYARKRAATVADTIQRADP